MHARVIGSHHRAVQPCLREDLVNLLVPVV
jgi:hypothetical protein